jgi:hypothetical protein
LGRPENLLMHLDHRDTERVRIRAFFFSENPSRASKNDPLRNWFDAEREEEGELLAVLAGYPHLFGVFSAAKPPPSLATCYVGYLLRAKRDEDVDFGLADVEAMLDVLIRRFGAPALYEQLDDLFVSSDATLSETRWVKAVTELHALARLQTLGKLDSLGWPPPSPGTSNTPPFDCRVDCPGGPIACDIKPASGSGFALVRDTLAPIVTAWASTHVLGPVEFFIHYTGTVTQQVLGPAVRQVTDIAQFATALNRHSTPPAAPIALKLGTTNFDITVAFPGSQYVSGGMQPASTLVSSLLPTLLNHIGQKTKGAVANGNVPFLLCYVRLPGSGGGDLKAAHLFRDWFAAASALGASLGAGNSLWLGVLLLDYLTGSPNSTCYLRPPAAWPSTVTPISLAAALSSTLELI